MKTPKKILITGGSGMIGKRLTKFLIREGYEIAHLGRAKKIGGVQTFLWNPYEKKIEDGAFRDVDVIIHLAGAGIGDRRWNEEWKKEILASRIETARFLKETLDRMPNRVSTFISSSGISYYGLNDPGRPFTETDAPGTDFMAGVTIQWEAEADKLSLDDRRVVKIRTGVVLSRESMALKRLAMPVKFFVGAPIGTGKQYFNWIHIDDLCRIYLKAIEDPGMRGAFNAVAPHAVTNKTLTKEIANVLNRPLWLPSIPAFLVRIIAGQVAEVVLKGGRISSGKIQSAGYVFQFPTIDAALREIYGKSQNGQQIFEGAG